MLERKRLRRVYRKRAMACHPDRAVSTGGCAVTMEREFSDVSQAHTILQNFVAGARQPPSQRPRPQRPPQHRWRFGEFLYYTQRVDPRTIESAIQLQRQSRPAIGTLAQHWGVLNVAQVDQILTQRLNGEGFASAAVRLGLLRFGQAEALLMYQTKQQKPLGGCLMGMGVVTHQQLHRHLVDYSELLGNLARQYGHHHHG